MQTFLPYASFERSARRIWSASTRCLPSRRGSSTRALHVPGYGWRHHPAVRMWRGCDEALAAYGLAVCGVWARAGCADTVAGKLVAELGHEPRRQAELRRLGLLPRWLGRRAFHLAHRSALIAKDPGWYRPRFPGVPEGLPYVWPEP